MASSEASAVPRNSGKMPGRFRLLLPARLLQDPFAHAGTSQLMYCNQKPALHAKLHRARARANSGPFQAPPRVKKERFRVWSFGFRVQGVGFRV